MLPLIFLIIIPSLSEARSCRALFKKSTLNYIWGFSKKQASTVLESANEPKLRSSPLSSTRIDYTFENAENFGFRHDLVHLSFQNRRGSGKLILELTLETTDISKLDKNQKKHFKKSPWGAKENKKRFIYEMVTIKQHPRSGTSYFLFRLKGSGMSLIPIPPSKINMLAIRAEIDLATRFPVLDPSTRFWIYFEDFWYASLAGYSIHRFIYPIPGDRWTRRMMITPLRLDFVVGE